jgi:hypothetical protein
MNEEVRAIINSLGHLGQVHRNIAGYMANAQATGPDPLTAVLSEHGELLLLSDVASLYKLLERHYTQRCATAPPDVVNGEVIPLRRELPPGRSR